MHRHRDRQGPVLAALLTVLLGACTETPPPEPRVDFTREILPILAENCLLCHGPDEGTRMGDLALHTRAEATRMRPTGQAIVPFDPGASVLVSRVRATDPRVRMPVGGQLEEREIHLLERWIAQGADYPSWSFTPPVRAALPAGSANAVDAFVHDRLASEGIEPSPPADPTTLIRRVTLDLTGLPPTPEEVDAFVADPSDAAYEALVDRLLASPRHAERLAEDWLDVAGYGDTNGIYFDEGRTMWPWRDWVIDAFAQNMPLDRFVIAQLAGDLLPDATEDDVLATAFLRHHPTTEEGGVDDEEYRIRYATDRATTVGIGLLGVTVQCARCHDHKYDPIPQADFYRLTACFNRVHDRGQTRGAIESDGYPQLSTLGPLRRAELARAREELTTARAALAALDVRGAVAEWETSLPAEPPTFVAPTYASMGSPFGTTLTAGAGARINASGVAPTSDTWELVIESPSDVTALRLTTGGGRARTPWLSEVSAWIEGDDHRRLVRFESARWAGEAPTVPAGGLPLIPSVLIDGSTTTSLDAFTSRVLLLVPSEPIQLAAGERLHLRIDQRSGLGATLGSLDVEVSSDARAVLDEALTEVLAQPVADRDPEDGAALDAFVARVGVSDAVRVAAQRVAALEAEIAAMEVLANVRVMRDDEPTRQTFVLISGQWDRHGDGVSCGIPGALTGGETVEVRDRRELAEWIMGPASPTTSRVLVNRYVQLLFDRGLVGTPEDFGSRGEVPEYAELLDWLAVELRESGWDLRQILRLLVTSETYRQSSVVREDLLDRDPLNRLLARGPRSRLDAETIRDQALFVGGLLTEQIGGPPVRPYHPDHIYESVNDHPDALLTTYRPDRSMESLHRRTLYTFWRRGTLLPSLALLDAPGRVVSTPRRDSTITPTQALALLDEPALVEAARALAERVRSEESDVDAQIQRAFRLVLSRVPTGEELGVLRAAYDEELASAETDSSVLGVLRVGDAPLDSNGAPAEHAAMTLVARTILILSETLTQE